MGRVSIFTRAAWLSVVLLQAAGTSAEAKNADTRTITTAERMLAQSGRRYLLCDVARRRWILMQLNAVLREYPFDLPDSQAVRYLAHLPGHGDTATVALIREAVILEASGRHSDTVVAVVARSTTAAPDAIQRQVPGRMLLVVGDNIVFDIVTETEGKAASFWQNILKSLSLRLQRLVRVSDVVQVTMKGNDAMSLAAAAQPGLPVVVLTDGTQP